MRVSRMGKWHMSYSGHNTEEWKWGGRHTGAGQEGVRAAHGPRPAPVKPRHESRWGQAPMGHWRPLVPEWGWWGRRCPAIAGVVPRDSPRTPLPEPRHLQRMAAKMDPKRNKKMRYQTIHWRKGVGWTSIKVKQSYCFLLFPEYKLAIKRVSGATSLRKD